MPKPIIQENFFETKKKDSKLYVSYMLNALVAQLRPTLCDPMDPLAHQAPLSMGFPRQEYWRGVSFPPSGDLPDPGLKPMPPASAGRFFTAEPPGRPCIEET